MRPSKTKIAPLKVPSLKRLSSNGQNSSGNQIGVFDDTFDEYNNHPPPPPMEEDMKIIYQKELYLTHFNIFCKGFVVCFTKKVFTPTACIILQAIPPITSFMYPLSEKTENYLLRGIYLTLLFFQWLLFFLLMFTDPGLLPKRIKEKADEFQIPYKLFPEEIVILNTGRMQEQMKYCQTCQIFRPPRASHCQICNCCIEVLDHHCPWLNICIGKKNYRIFYNYLLFVDAQLIYATVLHILFLISRKSINQVFIECLPSVITVIFLIPAAFFLSRLLFFHTKLLFSNQTTRDYMKLGPDVSLHTNCSMKSGIDRCFKQVTQPLLSFKETIKIVKIKHQLYPPQQLVFFCEDKQKPNSQGKEEQSEVSQSKLERFNAFKNSQCMSSINSAKSKRIEDSVVAAQEAILSPKEKVIQVARYEADIAAQKQLQRRKIQILYQQSKKEMEIKSKKNSTINLPQEQLLENGNNQKGGKKGNKSQSEAKLKIFKEYNQNENQAILQERLHQSDSNFAANFIFSKTDNFTNSAIHLNQFSSTWNFAQKKKKQVVVDTQPTLSVITNPFNPIEGHFQPLCFKDAQDKDLFHSQGEFTEMKINLDKTSQKSQNYIKNHNEENVFGLKDIFPPQTECEANDSKAYYYHQSLINEKEGNNISQNKKHEELKTAIITEISFDQTINLQQK